MSNAVANGLAGAGGGIIAQIITYPLQTVNTRQQTERVSKKGTRNSDGSSLTSKSRGAAPATGTLLQILQVIKTEGWGGLYSGLKPSLLGTAASQGIYYYFYQVFKNRAEAVAAALRDKGRGDGTVGMFSWLVVAAIAGSLNVLFTNPIWVLVTRMQTHTQAERKIMEERREALLREASERSLTDLQEKLAGLDSEKPRPYGTLHAAHEVYTEAGITGFWKGIVPTLIMVCNPSIQFMIYESLLKHLRAKRAANKQGSKTVTALEVFLSGALAKLGATVSTYPLLVVKHLVLILIIILAFAIASLVLISNSLPDLNDGLIFFCQNIYAILRVKRDTGTLDAIIKMIRYEGVPGFYKGMSTKIVQSVFAASVLFMVKEELVKAYMTLAHKARKLY